MKLTNNLYYFDFNATTPLANSVRDRLKGVSLCGNPSSSHLPGRDSKKIINQCREFLYETFNLDPKAYEILFHSGATEGINTFFKGINCKSAYVSSVDHAAAIEASQLYCEKVSLLEVDSKNFTHSLPASFGAEKSALNLTPVNNEIGSCIPQANIKSFIDDDRLIVHLDCAQLVGKITNWQKLPSGAAMYTFSGHKFGALLGIGFSFIKRGLKISPLIVGGSQQLLRSGTVNSLGIESLKLALTELIQTQDFDSSHKAITYLRDQIQNLLKGQARIIGYNQHHQNLNTIAIILPGNKTDQVVAAFDLHGIAISSGSACSIGASKPSQVLKGLGFSEEEARTSIRLSFSCSMTENDAAEYFSVIRPILSKFIK